jgi:hypothetical protein
LNFQTRIRLSRDFVALDDRQILHRTFPVFASGAANLHFALQKADSRNLCGNFWQIIVGCIGKDIFRI